MSFSQATLITRIRRILNDDPYLDTCQEVMDTTETGLDVTDGTQYAAGTTIEFQDDGELCYVKSVASNTLTVVRNYGYSVTTTAGTGTGHNQYVQIARRPLFQYTQITDAISGAINGLWPYVYKSTLDSVTPVAGTKWYNVTSPAAITLSTIATGATAVATTASAHGLGVGEAITIAGTNTAAYHASWVVSAVSSPTVFSFYVGTALGNATGGTVTSISGSVPKEISSAVQATTATTPVPFYYGINRGAYPIDLVNNVPTSIAASGRAYHIPFLNNTTNQILVNGIAPVTPTVTSGAYADLSDGLQTDCVSYYAVARLVASTDISRTTQEDITMGDESVTSGKRTSISAFWDQKGRMERNKWEQELKIILPRMQKWGHF